MEALLTATDKHSDDLHQQAVILSARYQSWARQRRLGLEKQDAELNSIHLSMLELHRLLGNTTAIRPARPATSPWLWAGLILGLVTSLGGIWLWNYFRAEDHRTEWVEGPGDPVSALPADAGATTAELPDLRAESATWRIKAHPFGAPARMSIAQAKLSAVTPTTREVQLSLEVTNEGEGWHPVQLVSSQFLMEQAGKARVTSTELGVLSIEPGETSTVLLAFEIEAVEQELVFLIRQQEGDVVKIPLELVTKK